MRAFVFHRSQWWRARLYFGHFEIGLNLASWFIGVAYFDTSHAISVYLGPLDIAAWLPRKEWR